MKRTVYIAGKNDIACNALSYLVSCLKYPINHLKVVPVKGDTGKHTWQRSLILTAQELEVQCISLEDCYQDESALFLSLEFDRIVRVEKFMSKTLYNIHFSKLPAYRGVGMAIWPLLNGETESGVTLHRIDAGIDTGDILAQRIFEIPLDWTSRDLYQAFLDESFVLFKDTIEDLIADRIEARIQDAVGASYFSKKALDYSNITIDFNRTSYQVHNQIRAYIFPEYQLPVVGGRKVKRSSITNVRSVLPPGTIKEVDINKAYISTVDYDVKVSFL